MSREEKSDKKKDLANDCVQRADALEDVYS